MIIISSQLQKLHKTECEENKIISVSFDFYIASVDATRESSEKVCIIKLQQMA